MAANQDINGLNASTVVLDDDYTPPTPEERGDFIVDDEPEQEEPEQEELDEEEEEGELDAEQDDLEEEDESTEEAGEDADEADSEEESEDEELEQPKGKSNAKVPLSRLNKEILKRRALEDELKQLRSAKEQPPKAETPKPEEQAQAFTREDFEGMQEAMLDGETDKAFEIFGKMMASQSQLVREATEAEVSGRVRSEIDRDRAVSELQSTAAQLSESYPELDSSNEDADQGLIEEVVEMRDLYVDRGMSMAEALKKSVKLVALDNGLVDRKAEKPKPDMAKPRQKPINAKRKLEAANKERGKLGGSGENNRPRIDISKLGDDEFGKLSKEALAHARGDYVE